VRRLRFFGIVLVLCALAGAVSAQQPDRLRDLEKQVQDLQRRLDQLSASADETVRRQVEELRRQIDVLTREIENLKSAAPEKAPEAQGTRGPFGLGPAASRVYGLTRGVSIGGYGEVLYQNFDDDREDGETSGRTDEIDLVRAVFYFGYKFDDRFLFNSEVEYEHATTGSGSEVKGEVSVEFAYLDFLPRREIGVRAGLLLLPVGFVNELHEPPIFLGARRPEVENRILPTTWRELGVGVFGNVGPVSYRAYVVNGLDAAGFSASSPIRGGRQKGSRARAEDFGLTGRLDFVGVPGLLAGVSGYVGDSAQGRLAAGESFDGRVTLFDAHAEWRWRGFQTRALLARGSIDDAAEINRLNGLSGTSSVGERFVGAYVEAGYDVLFGRGAASLVPFARWERFDTQDEVPSGFAASPANDVRVWTLGLQYRPIPQVVLKVDYQDFHNGARTGVDQWNLALGWLF
jgi:outer membrane murein-binding lipoprotein Lpp